MSKIKYPLLSDKSWLEEQVKLKSLRLIAKEVGCSYGGVFYSVKRFNIDVPNDSTRKKRPTPKNWLQNVRDSLKQKYPNGRYGELASNWKGGRKRTKSGYIYIYSPNHKYATKDGYVMEHRLVMEGKIGRLVLPEEDVNHINGVKDDNRPENLEVLSRKQHAQKHADAVKEVDRLKKILDEHDIAY